MAFQYPWGNLQGLNLTWFINQFKKLREDWATAEAGIDGALDAEIQKAEDALSDVFDARDAAAASATAAGNSASAAAASATAAGNSASAAASSATLANNKATAAGLSEAAAAISATNAGNSATAAQNSATVAGNSATAAGNSATAAGNSATAAGNSASAAAISESNAAASAQEAEDVLDSIPADYSTLSTEVRTLRPNATSADIGKALIVKTVTDGKVSEYEYGEAGGGGSNQIIPTEDCLFKDVFNKKYSYAGIHGRTGEVIGNHITIVSNNTSTTPVAYPIHGNTYETPFRYISSNPLSLVESDFIEINPSMTDFSIALLYDYDYTFDQGNNKGIGISLYTWQNGAAVLVDASVNYRYNYGKQIVYYDVLTIFPIFRETGKIYILPSSKSISANCIQNCRILIESAAINKNSLICRYMENNNIASRSYAVNYILTIGNYMYRVTAPIAAGAEIIENTNVSRIYISDVLTAFYNS